MVAHSMTKLSLSLSLQEVRVWMEECLLEIIPLVLADKSVPFEV